jgi:hypothetical protein
MAERSEVAAPPPYTAFIQDSVQHGDKISRRKHPKKHKAENVVKSIGSIQKPG